MGNILGQLGIQWNVSIPDVGVPLNIILTSIEEGVILASWESIEETPQAGLPSDYTTYPSFSVEVAYNATTGDELWVQNRTNVQGRVFYSNNIGDGVYTRYDSPTLQIYGYDIKTGQELWVTDPISTSGWAYYTYMHHIAYGKLYTLGYDGYVRAWNLTTGKLEWDSYFGSAGYETPYGTWPSYTGPTIADGKIYITNDDHSPDAVPWRGGKLWVFDAETGDLLWSISGWLRHGAITDGILTALNSLDGQVYAFGKGPTATTVSASQTVVANGSTVLIEGTVMDQSPGQPGTPCVSKESMSAWMEFLHMQKPCPMETTGVPVKLEAFGADGSYVDIGTVTSDVNGFRHEWIPPDEGLYTILATFNGDESYGSSWGATGLSVGPAPPPPEEPAEEPAYTTIDLAIIAAVVVAIVIGIVNLWALRKR